MVLDKNTSPYYDDYDGTKKYYQIMFRPGFAVQARELSQIQSTLQEQVSRLGDSIYKEGSMVIPGDSSVDVAYPFVTLQTQYSGADIVLSNFANKKIIGLTSGTIATVLETVAAVAGDPNTLYVKYETGVSSQSFNAAITSGSTTFSSVSISATDKIVVGSLVSGSGVPSNTFITQILSANSFKTNNAATTSNASATITATTSNGFADGETIVTVNTDGTTQVFNALTSASGSTGFGSRATIKEGVYYAQGYFCYVEEQEILLDKYGNTPSYKIGLKITDDFITDANDVSLVDPATGSPNFNAPGADRYFIDLVFSKFGIDDTVSDNFIELIRIKDGQIQSLVTRPAYSELETTLARRTYDESGDYTVKSFPVQIKEHLNTGTNFGVYTALQGGDATKLVAAIEPGKAYVRGYEIETKATNYLDVDKARDFGTVNSAIVPFSLGNSMTITKLSGLINITGFTTVNLVNTVKGGGGYPGTTLGTAKVRGLDFISGTPGTAGALYSVNLYDVQMASAGGGNLYSLSDVKGIYLSASVNADAVQVNSETILNDTTDNAAILNLPELAIKSLKDGSGNIDTVYGVKRYFTGTMTTTTITLTANTNEIFATPNIINYQLAVITPSSTATGNGIAAGAIINLTASGNSVVLSGSPTGRQAVITVPTISGSTVAVIATVEKSNVQAKTKTLSNRTTTIAHTSTIQLDKADIYAITSITDATTSQVITDRYVLDNGQRDNYYDRGQLLFKTNYPAPTGNVVIVYQYFDHGAGDFFSVDSYNGVVPYEDIPVYVSPTTGITYDLKNAIDFRSRVNDAGTGYSVTSEILPNGQQFQTDYSYYLARVDKAYLDSFGNFRLLKGVPDRNPVAPNDPTDGMVLYTLNIPAYTLNTQDVIYQIIDNKRYTMRDIGKLEKRIDNLEYYTSLSLLEKATSDLYIDDGTGSNAFKNGFLVDNFSSHLIGDVTLPEYQCSIDTANGILRAGFQSNNVDMAIQTAESSNYVVTGGLVTLPYTVVNFISQPHASKTENINPYNVFNWVGAVKLVPETDDWYDTTQAPDMVIVNDDGLADKLAAQNGGTTQVIWNDWQTTWIGTPISETVTNQYGYTADRRSTGISHSQGWLQSRLVTQTLVSQEEGQTRSGVQTTVVSQVTNQNLGDRVVNQQAIPYIRPAPVQFTATAMKPNTEVYPFFDNVSVAAFCKPTGGNLGDPLITDNSGQVSGEFDIPSNSTVQFRTGERVFKLVDSDDNDVNFITTSGQATYTAAGVLDTLQATVISTRTAELVQTTVTDSRTIIGTDLKTTDVATSSWYDPVAQTFLVSQPGGVFLNKIDIYFATKDATGLPVTLQVRTVVNGYPGPNILPGSTVTLNPTQVNVSTDGQTATSFVFDAPIYLNDATEYCFVIISNSNQYTIWCSNLGDIDVFSGARISEQPYAGVMFKSQNASTWTADQDEDIKFDISRCVFDTSVVGTTVFRNVDLTKVPLSQDPLYTTNGTANVIVYLPNHSLRGGDKTTISGVTATLNGIAAVNFNRQFTVSVIDFDHFQITLATGTANKTGSTGGTGIFATSNIKADVINAYAETIVLPSTGLDWSIKVRDEDMNFQDAYVPIITKSNVEFTDERYIYSTDNEATGQSAVLQAQMATDNDAVSPVIDLQRLSLILVSNRINNDSSSELLARSGAALSRYITKKISLSTSANTIRVYFSASRPPLASISVYVKYQLDSDKTTLFDNLPYYQLNAIDYPAGAVNTFNDYTFELDNLDLFSVFAIKIVLNSSETSDVPLIKDFRTIALST